MPHQAAPSFPAFLSFLIPYYPLVCTIHCIVYCIVIPYYPLVCTMPYYPIVWILLNTFPAQNTSTFFRLPNYYFFPNKSTPKLFFRKLGTLHIFPDTSVCYSIVYTVASRHRMPNSSIGNFETSSLCIFPDTSYC